MAAESEIAVTFLIYLLFFAWLGYRRGFRAEAMVFLVTLVSWIGLDLFGDIVVRVANLGGKFATFAASGGLSAGEEEALQALQSAPDVITEANRESFLFLIWVLLVVITYMITSRQGGGSGRRSAGGALPVTPGALIDTLAGVLSGQGRPTAPPPDTRLRGWSVIFGIANGLLFASIFLPRLLALLSPQPVVYGGIPEEASPLRLLGAGIGVVADTVRQIWRVIQPEAPWVLLLLLTLFLVLAASTLRGGSGGGSAGSRSRGGPSREANGRERA
jgi:hypothetical protein